MAVNKSVLMPVWGGVLSDKEIQDLVSYLREVCKCGKK
jgi:mono/diheme cytochrome c family protein